MNAHFHLADMPRLWLYAPFCAIQLVGLALFAVFYAALPTAGV